MKHLAKQEFARRLYTLMVDKGWRQADLARRSMLPRNAISVYLRGASLPNPDSLKALANAFNMDPGFLLSNDREGPTERNSSELEFRVSPADPRKAWLRIHRVVSTSIAIKIMALIEAEDAAHAD